MDDYRRRGWQKFTFFGGQLERPDVEAHQLSPPGNAVKSFPLSQTHTGDRVWIVGFTTGTEGIERLASMGLTRGTELEIVNRTAGGSIMVGVANTRLGLGVGVADKIYVRRSGIQETPNGLLQQDNANQYLTQEKSMQTHLRDLAVGGQGRVTGYSQGTTGYRQQLLAMGLTPGTEFTITRQAPLGDPVELKVRGFQLSLRKAEADALIVEAIDHA